MKNTYLLSLLVVLLFTTSCSKDEENYGYAFTSVVGKTITVGDRPSWIFTSNSSFTVDLPSSTIYDYEMMGTPTCVYKVSGYNKATITLKYIYRKSTTFLDMDMDYTYTHSYNLTLTFSDKGLGTASGSYVYTYYDNDDGDTDETTYVVSNETFVVTDSK